MIVPSYVLLIFISFLRLSFDFRNCLVFPQRPAIAALTLFKSNYSHSLANMHRHSFISSLSALSLLALAQLQNVQAEQSSALQKRQTVYDTDIVEIDEEEAVHSRQFYKFLTVR